MKKEDQTKVVSSYGKTSGAHLSLLLKSKVYSSVGVKILQCDMMNS